MNRECLLSRFSCVQLCDQMHGSLLGCSVHGISQARILEWVAISFSNEWRNRGHFFMGGSAQYWHFCTPPPMRMIQSSLITQLQFLGVSRFSQVYHTLFCFTFCPFCLFCFVLIFCLFLYFLLCWSSLLELFSSFRGWGLLSSVASTTHCGPLLFLLLQSTGCRTPGLSSCSFGALEHRLNSCGVLA